MGTADASKQLGRMMERSSFSILGSKYPELYHVAIEAENYAHSDHSAFLLKIRMFLEIWCHEFSFQKTDQVHIEPKLFDKIEQLRLLDIIPTAICSLLHETRAICNKGVHLTFDAKRGFCQVLEISDNEVNQCLSTIFRLAALLIGEQNLSSLDGLQMSEQAKLVAAVKQGFLGDAKASLNVAKLIHSDLKLAKTKSKFTEHDLVYWLNKALAQKCNEALAFYSQLITEHRYKSITLHQLKTWLDEFKSLKNSEGFAFIAAKTHEKLGEMRTALKYYQQAAEQGCFHSIKRLQDYWISRDQDRFHAVIILGSNFNERRSVFYLLMYLAINVKFCPAAENDVQENLKELKKQYLKAKSFCVEGLAYAEALLGFYRLLGLNLTIEQFSIEVEKSWVKAPKSLMIDVAIFHELYINMVCEPFMVSIAQSSIQLCKEPDMLANLEFDLALLQARLTAERKPFTAKQNTRELLKSAARRGHKEAISVLSQLNGRFSKRIAMAISSRINS